MLDELNEMPDWAIKAKYRDSKPEWEEKIPRELWSLGRVFVPWPNGTKSYAYPHGNEEYRYNANDEILNAYFDSGWGYAIACDDALTVVDVDWMGMIDEVVEHFPTTMWQVSGSREGIHLFYKVPGLDRGRKLYMTALGGYVAFGDIKCNEHEIVFGPGHRHPSGNKYGPLKGDSITRLSKQEFLECYDPFKKPESDNRGEVRTFNPDSLDSRSSNEFYGLTVDDVVPWLGRGKRVPHPVHGSRTTGKNFMKQQDEDLFMCWRHNYGRGPGCALNANHFLAVKKTGDHCDTIRERWNREPKYHWRAYEQAVADGHVSIMDIPYTAVLGYADANGMIDSEETVHGLLYHEFEQQAICTLVDRYTDVLPTQPPD